MRSHSLAREMKVQVGAGGCRGRCNRSTSFCSTMQGMRWHKHFLLQHHAVLDKHFLCQHDAVHEVAEALFISAPLLCTK